METLQYFGLHCSVAMPAYAVSGFCLKHATLRCNKEPDIWVLGYPGYPISTSAIATPLSQRARPDDISVETVHVPGFF